MRGRRSRGRDIDSSEIANRMADAVTYLSKIADDAGMEVISAELLAVRTRLEHEAKARTAEVSGKPAHRDREVSAPRRVK
jgi:hypothetical protein